MKSKYEQKGKIIIYQTSKKEVELQVHVENESVWLRQNEISELFDKDRTVITKHINNIFQEREVKKKNNVQFLHIASSDKPVAYYSLDVVLAVGYRTNSARAIHFRKWATQILKKYIIEGYAVNTKRLQEAREKLKELQNTISFFQEQGQKKQFQGQEQEILYLLAQYAKTLTLLGEYDKGTVSDKREKKTKFVLQYNNCLHIISKIKKELIGKKEASALFGMEREGSFQSIIKNLYQTFDGKQLYQTIEERASHLLYLIIKDHPFSDGNKRIASFLFIYFLDNEQYLYRPNGEKKINDNALTALALLIAESNPKEKKTMIKIIKNILK